MEPQNIDEFETLALRLRPKEHDRICVITNKLRAQELNFSLSELKLGRNLVKLMEENVKLSKELMAQEARAAEILRVSIDMVSTPISVSKFYLSSEDEHCEPHMKDSHDR